MSTDMRQTSIFDQSVADRIQSLLARCDAIRRGCDIDRPHLFDDQGEKHATEVARRDMETH